MKTERQAEAQRVFNECGRNYAEASRRLDACRKTVQELVARAEEWDRKKPKARVESFGYDLSKPDRTAKEAWDSHADAFERAASKVLKSQWRTIERKGPFCLFHSTDEHLDDDKTPLRIIEEDIKAAHDMDAIMVHGGDALNNWPMAGKLAAQWSQQQCTAPDALLRLKHFISIFKPDVWTDGNHEEMNPYLDAIIADALPPGVIRDYWAVKFRINVPGGRPMRAIASHKFQKGSSWFHKVHGHIREMLEGEEADLLIDGHVHSDGVLDHTLPERLHAALCVASAGYKILDKYASRISRGGTIPKMRGRAHWIIGDPFADFDANLFMAFKDPRQAEAYLNGLQNLRAA